MGGRPLDLCGLYCNSVSVRFLLSLFDDKTAKSAFDAKTDGWISGPASEGSAVASHTIFSERVHMTRSLRALGARETLCVEEHRALWIDRKNTREPQANDSCHFLSNQSPPRAYTLTHNQIPNQTGMIRCCCELSQVDGKIVAFRHETIFVRFQASQQEEGMPVRPGQSLLQESSYGLARQIGRVHNPTTASEHSSKKNAKCAKFTRKKVRATQLNQRVRDPVFCHGKRRAIRRGGEPSFSHFHCNSVDARSGARL